MTGKISPEQPRQFLEARLRSTPGAMEAFQKLCQKCDSDILAGLCYLIMRREPITLPVPKGERQRRGSTRRRVTIHDRPLDSWDSATAGFDLEDLRKIARDAAELWNKILRLRRSPLVRFLIQIEQLPRSSDDLLTGLPGSGNPFRGLKELPKLAKGWAGPRQKPDFTRLLTTLCKYVRERTGDWHDREVSDVLNALTLVPDAPKDLKQWRYDHGLTNPGRGKDQTAST